MSKLTQAVSAVSPLGDALREPVKKPRAPRKATKAPAVGTTYQCAVCPYRTDDQRAYMGHLRTEIADLQSELAEVREGLPRKANGRRFIAECGTVSGYRRHRKRGEPACEACRNAENATHRRRRAANPEKRTAADRASEARRAQDPAWRERRNARRRKLYAAQKAAGAPSMRSAGASC